MAKITLDYKDKEYEFIADNTDELLEQAKKAFGISNLELADLNLTPGEQFTENRVIKVTLETERFQGKTYVIRKLVNEEKGSNKRPANENGELHLDNAITLLTELAKEQPNDKLIKDCLADVTKLNLPDCELDPLKLSKLQPSLSNLNLVTINLSHNRFRDTGARILVDILRKSTQLQVLNIAYAGISTAHALYTLLHSLKTPDCLTTVDLSGNYFQNPELPDYYEALAREKLMSELALLLQRAPNLRILRLNSTNIYKETLKLLAASLCSPTCPVRVLSLNNNHNLGEGHEAKNIAKIIEQSPLEKLYLRNDYIGDNSILKVITNSLKDSKTLKTLDMRGNGRKNREIRMFAAVLPRLTLRKLYLFNEKYFLIPNASETTHQAIRSTIVGNEYTLRRIAAGFALNKSLIYLPIPKIVKEHIISQIAEQEKRKLKNDDLLPYLKKSLQLIEEMEGYLERNKQLLNPLFLFSIDDRLLLPTVLTSIVLEYLDNDVDYQLSTKIAKFLNKHTNCQWKVTTSGTYQAVLSNEEEAQKIVNNLRPFLQKFGMNSPGIITIQNNTVTLSIPAEDMNKFEQMVSEPSTKKKIKTAVSNTFGTLFSRKKDKKDEKIPSPTLPPPPKADEKNSLPESPTPANAKKAENTTGGTPTNSAQN